MADKKPMPVSSGSGSETKTEGAGKHSFLRACFIYPVAFVLTAVVLCGILVLSAMIPRDAIRKNMESSARFLYEGELFGAVVEGVASSRIDRYADSILLNIGWNFDSSKPLESVMLSAYYFSIYQEENENFYASVFEGLPANQQYLRYWHGSLAFVRPLMLLMPVQGMYVLNAVILAVLAILLVVMLFRRKLFYAAAGVCAGMVLTAFWFVPLSLEYTWVCLIAFIAAVTALLLEERGKESLLGFFFLITGMLTSFMDFLTAETLTLLVPLLVVLAWMRKSDSRVAESAGLVSQSNSKPLEGSGSVLRTAVIVVLSWGAGYVLMWGLKWCMASVVLKANVMPYVTEHVGERLAGSTGTDVPDSLIGAIFNNILCLFPIDYGIPGAVIFTVLLVLFAYICFVYRELNIDVKVVSLYIVCGLLPYVRYIVLRNHSFIHCFFTYRAQMATVLALVLVSGELGSFRLLKERLQGGKKRPGRSKSR